LERLGEAAALVIIMAVVLFVGASKAPYRRPWFKQLVEVASRKRGDFLVFKRKNLAQLEMLLSEKFNDCSVRRDLYGN
jgi:hypothetical protein